MIEKVTTAMTDAGNQIASDLYDAQISKALNGLGGCPTFEQWLDKDIKNRNLILAYLNEEIDSGTAIYLAMDRERIAAMAAIGDNKNTCSRCKHWDKYSYGACLAVDYNYGHDFNETVKSDSFFIDVVADDDSGLDAQLKTGPDFSCIKFEEKE